MHTVARYLSELYTFYTNHHHPYIGSTTMLHDNNKSVNTAKPSGFLWCFLNISVYFTCELLCHGVFLEQLRVAETALVGPLDSTMPPAVLVGVGSSLLAPRPCCCRRNTSS